MEAATLLNQIDHARATLDPQLDHCIRLDQLASAASKVIAAHDAGASPAELGRLRANRERLKHGLSTCESRFYANETR